MQNNRLTISEILFIAVVSTAIGISWVLYSFLYDIISPFLKPMGINDILEGFWYISGIFFAYIIRKPGSAIIGETISATIEGVISQWGISAVLSGVLQGGLVEILFLICRYKIWNKTSLILSGALSGIGGFLVNYYFYGYNLLSLQYNVTNLICNIISGIFLGGILAKYLADNLAKTGVLSQYQISKTL